MSHKKYKSIEDINPELLEKYPTVSKTIKLHEETFLANAIKKPTDVSDVLAYSNFLNRIEKNFSFFTDGLTQNQQSSPALTIDHVQKEFAQLAGAENLLKIEKLAIDVSTSTDLDVHQEVIKQLQEQSVRSQALYYATFMTQPGVQEHIKDAYDSAYPGWKSTLNVVMDIQDGTNKNQLTTVYYFIQMVSHYEIFEMKSDKSNPIDIGGLPKL